MMSDSIKESLEYWRGVQDGYLKAIHELPEIIKRMNKPTIIVVSEEQKKKILEEWNQHGTIYNHLRNEERV